MKSMRKIKKVTGILLATITIFSLALMVCNAATSITYSIADDASGICSMAIDANTSGALQYAYTKGSIFKKNCVSSVVTGSGEVSKVELEVWLFTDADRYGVVDSGDISVELEAKASSVWENTTSTYHWGQVFRGDVWADAHVYGE